MPQVTITTTCNAPSYTVSVKGEWCNKDKRSETRSLVSGANKPISWKFTSGDGVTIKIVVSIPGQTDQVFERKSDDISNETVGNGYFNVD